MVQLASELRGMAALMSATTMIGFERQVIAPVANPFATRWVPAGTPQPDGIGEVRPVTGQQDVTHIGGGSLHPGDSNGSDLRPSWHHVTIDQIGEALFDPAGEVPSADVSQSLGNTATLLKGRITLAVGNARRQTIDFDLLAGLDFSVAAQHVLSIEALVPDPESIDPDASPPDLPTLSLATTVCTGVYCGLAPRGTRMTLTYSQVFFLAGERIAFMPVVPAAREVEVLVTQPAVAANSVVVDFLYVLENPLIAQASNTFAPNAFLVGSVNVPIGAMSTPRVTIPGNCNMIRVTQSGLTDLIVNVVQLLKF